MGFHSSRLLRIHSAKNDHVKNELGQSMLEFALIFPVFIIIVLGLVDFVRYLTALGVLNSAANRALSVAAVVDGLDNDCSDCSTNADETAQKACETACEARRNAAAATVADTARTIPRDLMVGDSHNEGMIYFKDGASGPPPIEITVSTPNNFNISFSDVSGAPTITKPSGSTLRATLQEQPMEVTLRAEMQPFLWILPTLNLTATKVGFREPRFVTSFPARLDCNGNQIPIGGEAPAEEECKCPLKPNDPLMYINPDDPSTCVCAPPFVFTTSPGDEPTCECPPPQVRTGDSCGCPTGIECKGGTINKDSCECTCPQTFQLENAECVCPSPKYVNKKKRCVCPSGARSDCEDSGGTYNSGDCSCSGCPALKELVNGECVCETVLSCVDGEFNSANCACCASPKEIQNGVCACPFEEKNDCLDSGGSYDNAKCECSGCPTLKKLENGACVCETELTCTDGEFNSANCTCCTKPKVLNSNNVCACPSGSRSKCENSGGSYKSSDCSCSDCPSGKKEVDGACVCEIVPNCPPDTFNPNTCSCCPSPYEYSNGQCQCPWVPCDGGAVNGTSCECECPEPKTNEGGTCTCPPKDCGRGTPDSSDCGCDCPTNESYDGTTCVCGPINYLENGVCKRNE